MVDNDYATRTQAILVALFFHYFGYLVMLILDALNYSNRVHLTYNLKTLFKKQTPGPPTDTKDNQEQAAHDELRKPMSELDRQHPDRTEEG